MNIWNIIENICLIGSVVCLAVAIALGVSAEIEARKLRREIMAELKKRKESDSQ